MVNCGIRAFSEPPPDAFSLIASGDRIPYNQFFERPEEASAKRHWPQKERALTLTCPNCGNNRNFQVKTVQMHVVHLDDERVEVSEEGRPAVLEVLCDECESALSFEEFEDALRREVLLTIGAR
jgi:5-methylcytosine-specific restriction endonuclease McrA